MSKFRQLVGSILIVELLLVLLLNVLYLEKTEKIENRLYRVEAARVAEQLQEQTPEEIALEPYRTIAAVSRFRPEEEGRYDYVVKQVGDTLYRIEYRQSGDRSGLLFLNAALGGMLLATLFFSWYLGKKIVKPFSVMSELPRELAKGNLVVPVKEEKSKFFGRFLWGMDMLRDKLESNKEKELELQKEKKTLLLSLTHDIATPLSAIKLYTRAVSEKLYDTEEQQQEALRGIQKNVVEIENYIKEIKQTAREDFLHLEVVPGEFYVSELLQSISSYYKEKLALVHTEFVLLPQPDCLLKGDKNRMVEVLQNVMENAVKYGDGRKIIISGEEEEDCRLITVTNTGCSIPEEELPNLFDSFYRGSNSQNIKGSGLGLYICKKLMQQMDGEIFATASQDTFHITVVIRKA